MYYSLHTTETAEHHTGNVKYGRTQKRQTWDETYTIVGRKSNNNKKKKKKEIALKEIEKQSGKFKGKGKDVEINIFMVVL